MPRKDQGWVTFQLPEAERQLLEQYCQESMRGKTDVLRELVRTLVPSTAEPEVPLIQKKRSTHQKLEIQTLRVSARNMISAKIKRVTLGSINAEILLEIAPGIEIISIITRASSESLELTPGKQAYVVVKSSDVIVAVE